MPANGTPPPSPAKTKTATATAPAPDPILEKLQQHGGDLLAANQLAVSCRKAAPDVTDREISQLIDHWIDERKPRSPVGWMLKHLPGKLADGGLAKWREEAKADRPKEKCRQCDRTGIWRNTTCPVCNGTGWV